MVDFWLRLKGFGCSADAVVTQKTSWHWTNLRTFQRYARHCSWRTQELYYRVKNCSLKFRSNFVVYSTSTIDNSNWWRNKQNTNVNCKLNVKKERLSCEQCLFQPSFGGECPPPSTELQFSPQTAANCCRSFFRPGQWITDISRTYTVFYLT